MAEASRFSPAHSEPMAGINAFLKYVTWLIVPAGIPLLATQFAAADNASDAVTGAVAGVVTMVPEGLVPMTSIAFAVGVVRVGRRRCLVQELPAIESLASLTKTVYAIILVVLVGLANVRFAVPAVIACGGATFAGYYLATEQPPGDFADLSTTASVALFALTLWVLALIARPWNWWRLGLVAAMAAAFAVVLSVPPLRHFFALEACPTRNDAVALAIAVAAAVPLAAALRYLPDLANLWRRRRADAGPLFRCAGHRVLERRPDVVTGVRQRGLGLQEHHAHGRAGDPDECVRSRVVVQRASLQRGQEPVERRGPRERQPSMGAEQRGDPGVGDHAAPHVPHPGDDALVPGRGLRPGLAHVLQDQAGHPGQERVPVGDVAVDRHRRHPEPLGGGGHGQGFQAALVEHASGGEQDVPHGTTAPDRRRGIH